MSCIAKKITTALLMTNYMVLPSLAVASLCSDCKNVIVFYASTHEANVFIRPNVDIHIRPI
jgi:hypothetical protein